MKEYFTLEETAKRYTISITALRQAIRDKKLRAAYVARKYYVSDQAMTDFMNSRSHLRYGDCGAGSKVRSVRVG